MSERNSYEEVIRKILDVKKELTREDVEALIEEKLKEYGDIIRKDAAALMLAKELGVELPSETTYRIVGRLQIKDLAVGFRGVDIVGTIIEMNPPSLSRDGRRYVRFIIADETGNIPVIVWDENVDKVLEELPVVGDVIFLEKMIVKRYRDRKELLFSNKSSIKRIGRDRLDKLLELIGLHKAKSFLFYPLLETCNGDVCCIYGYSVDSKLSKIVCRREVGERIKLKQFHVLTGSGLFVKELDNMLFVKCFENVYLQNIPEKYDNLIEKFENIEDIISFFTIQGIIMGYILFKKEGGRILFLEYNNKMVNIPVFDNESLEAFSSKLGKCVEIIGVRNRVNDDIRIDDCFSINEISCPEKFMSPQFKPARLLDGSGFIRVRANITSANLYLTCYKDKVFSSLILKLDDGLEVVTAIANREDIISELLSIEPIELCDYDENSRKKILEFLTQKILGGEFIFYGYLSKDNNNAIFNLLGVRRDGEEEEKA